MDDVQLLKIIPPVVDLLTPPHHIRSLASPQHASRVREEVRNPGASTEALQVSPVKMRVKKEVVTPKRGWQNVFCDAGMWEQHLPARGIPICHKKRFKF